MGEALRAAILDPQKLTPYERLNRYSPSAGDIIIKGDGRPQITFHGAPALTSKQEKRAKGRKFMHLVWYMIRCGAVQADNP